MDCIQGYERKLRKEQKQREAAVHDETYMLFMQALQIGNVVACLFDKTKQINGLNVYYPGLYKSPDTEENQAEDFTEQEEGDKHQLTLEMELHKANMDDFVFRHNLAMAKKRGEQGGGNDTGKAASDHRGTD